MTCNAAIRPMMNGIEIRCELDGVHEMHKGSLKDFAFDGSVTMISWNNSDRRSYYGEWPGFCYDKTCCLPNTHHGDHASY